MAAWNPPVRPMLAAAVAAAVIEIMTGLAPAGTSDQTPAAGEAPGEADAARTGLAPEVLLLARIKVRMAENLERLPNYTCLQTIERSRRRLPSRRFELLDTLRMEVALVSGKELFAWPGESNFEERELSEMSGGGAMGNGNFGLHARAVFLSAAPVFTYRGETREADRKVVTYDYRVPRMMSGYQLKLGEAQEIVAYHGSILVDAATLDLIRLEVHADDIPASLAVASAGQVMEYRRLPIGEADFLLPSASELSIVDLKGNESRNRTQFSKCRHYAGESVLSFDEPPEDAPVKAAPRQVTLPGDLTLILALEKELQFSRAAIGDEVLAKVQGNVKRKGQVIVPSGATARGRLVLLEKISGGRLDYHRVGLRFYTLEYEGTEASFQAVLDSILMATPGTSPYLMPRAAQSGAGRDAGNGKADRTAGAGVFYVRGNTGRLPRGLRMFWRTE